MYLPEFNFHKPATLREALDLLNREPGAVPMAGGTDLLVEIKKGLRAHSDIVSLGAVGELKEIRADKDYLYIGACATHSSVMESPLVAEFAGALSEATAKIGSAQIRNAGTIGGNICTAASCCDTAPVLLALRASVEIACGSNRRTIPLKEFFTFNKRTVLKNGELVTRIIIPKPKAGTGCRYEKFGLRDAGAIAVVSVAVSLQIRNGSVNDAIVVIGAVAPTPKISDRANAVLTEKLVTELSEGSALLDRAGEAAVMDSIPIDDIRGGAQFRRDVLKVLTKRAIQRAIERA